MCRELDTQIEIPSPVEEENSEKIKRLANHQSSSSSAIHTYTVN